MSTQTYDGKMNHANDNEDKEYDKEEDMLIDQVESSMARIERLNSELVKELNFYFNAVRAYAEYTIGELDAVH